MMGGEGSRFCMVYVTVPSEDHARTIVKALLDKRLIACANVIPMRSFYNWEGQEREDDELVLIMKTRSELYERIEAEVRGLHPYKVPCILLYEVGRGFAPYMDWIDEETRGKGAAKGKIKGGGKN